jgi:hypothetical protein
LLDQLPDVVAHDGNAAVELFDGGEVGHGEVFALCVGLSMCRLIDLGEIGVPDNSRRTAVERRAVALP